TNKEGPAGSTATVTVGSTVITSYDATGAPAGKTEVSLGPGPSAPHAGPAADPKSEAARFTGELGTAVSAAGYPVKAD
ncbi:hypothetical protein RF145_14205, partial [Escherichia coli]|uniref:hypothetical protein n=1 Tax=Escherichia coli TaxID=562 RepID=UPI0028135E24